MTGGEETLWRVVAASLDASPDDLDGQTEYIGEELTSSNPPEILAFAHQMDAALERANTWNLWGAAYIINGGASDDGFLYFRGWLLMQGQKVFAEAVRDPETLVNVSQVEPEACEWEDILYLVPRLYREATGQELPPSGHAPEGEPSGEPWEEDDLEIRFPRLWAAFGEA